MTSAIDPTSPRTGRASTARVRGNYEAAKQEIEELQKTLLVSGYITMYPAVSPPGWTSCNGSEVGRLSNPNLFSLIGTTYGAGDGSTTFNVPDMRAHTVRGTSSNVGDTGGSDTHELTLAEMPVHGHTTTEDGEHDHGGTTEGAGGHTHTASSQSAGAHTHSGSTSINGDHSHTLSTNTTGSHTHVDGGPRTWQTDPGFAEVTLYPRGTSTVNQGPLTTSNGAHSHSVSINSSGSHSHSGSVGTAGSHSDHTGTVPSSGAHAHTIDAAGSHTHTVDAVGTGQAHNNIPPVIGVIFIIKLG